MRTRLFALCTMLALGSCDEAPEPVTAHIRARIETDFAFTEVVWVDVVVSWGSSCKAEEWFITSQMVPNNITNNIFVSLPTSFDVLPEHPDGREMITIFVAGRNTLGVLATDWRSLSFEPGQRVETVLSLRNPCSPKPCELDYELGSQPPNDWCALSFAALKDYSARTCSCVSGGSSEFDPSDYD